MGEIYPAWEFSKGSYLTADISAEDTEIPLLDGADVPDAPNILILGERDVDAGIYPEGITYEGKTLNTLTGCVRGVIGTAQVWTAGTPARRNFTSYDHDAIREAIVALQVGADGDIDGGSAASTYLEDDDIDCGGA